MPVELVIERVHDRSFLSIRAYRLIFTDLAIYCLHLGEDSSAMPLGRMAGGLVGAAAQALSDKLSEKSIAKHEKQIEELGLDAAVEKDKRSAKIFYSDLEAFETASYKWNRWPQLTFKFRGKKLTLKFNPAEEDYEDKRVQVLNQMLNKCPSICKNVL